MRASRFFIATLKEAPADAEIISHRLMMRAGLIKRLGSGIYNYMPMGLRIIRKVESEMGKQRLEEAATSHRPPGTAGKIFRCPTGA